MRINKILTIYLTGMMILLPWCGFAKDKAPTVRYEYAGIPFDSITPSLLEQIIQDQFGEAVKDKHGHYYIISDFGYTFYLDVQFNNSNVGASRVILMKPGECYAPYEKYKELYTKNIQQFLDMENQLANRYGEPRWRYFTANNAKYLGRNVPMRMMFPGGKWRYEDMMAVLDHDSKTLIAHSRWENIRLEVWVDWKNEAPRGYLSKLTVFFESDSWPSSAQPGIVTYPPTNP